MAEARGVLEVYIMVRQHGYFRIVVESDSKEIITWLNGCIEQGSWQVFLVLCEISKEGRMFSSCDWSWVPRAANEVADFVASHAGVEMCDFVWVRKPPSSFVRVLNKDGFP